MKFNALAFGLVLLIELTSASAQPFALVPAKPEAFDPVVLRMTVDSCVYDPDAIGVRKQEDLLIVNAGIRNCLVPGPLRVIDVRLGTFPVGRYRVLLEHSIGGTTIPESPPAFIATFDVTSRPTVAIFPPPKRPLNDWSGNWVTQTELGWGLSIQQSPTDVLFAQLFVYAVNGLPVWFTFQDGQWKSATRWEGKLFASAGPGYSEPVFDPRQVVTQPLGTATIEFEQTPGNEAFATLHYVVGNVPVTKRIRKLLF